MAPKTPPKGDDSLTFDGPRFGQWLTRWKEQAGFDWEELADKASLHISTIHNFRRGTPQSNRGRSPKVVSINPPINSLIRLARALDMELGYLVSKAGVASYGDRWQNFSHSERLVLTAVLRQHLAIEHATGIAPSSKYTRQLLEQLEATLPTQPEDTE